MTIILRQSFSFVGTSRTNRFEYTKQFRVEVGIHIFVGKHFDTVVIGNLHRFKNVYVRSGCYYRRQLVVAASRITLRAVPNPYIHRAVRLSTMLICSSVLPHYLQGIYACGSCWLVRNFLPRHAHAGEADFTRSRLLQVLLGVLQGLASVCHRCVHSASDF